MENENDNLLSKISALGRTDGEIDLTPSSSKLETKI
jgi:hypothetical protein